VSSLNDAFIPIKGKPKIVFRLIRTTCVLLLASLALTLSVSAQDVVGVAQPTLGRLSVESKIALANVGSAGATAIAPNVLAAIQAGALEIRQLVSYEPAQAALRFTGFVVAPGAPIPTALTAQPLNVIWSYAADVTQTQFPRKPKNSILFTATIHSAVVSPFGDVMGAPVFFSASYTPAADTVTAFAAVSTSIVGAATIFAPAGSGNAEIHTPSPADTLPIAVAGPKGTQTLTGVFTLDGTKSCDPSGGSLTYQWTFLPRQGETVDLAGADTATPSVVIPMTAVAYGDYTFLLTVTNLAGLTSQDTVTITVPYPDEPPPPQS
jgi:hypothetical protein